MDISNFQNQLSIVNDWIKVADQKISILIAILIGSIGLFNNNIIALVVNSSPYSPALFAILLAAWVSTLGWAIIKLIIALSPTIKNNNESILYFGHIAVLNKNDFARQISRLNSKQYSKALIEQIHTNSKIASKKHQLLKESVRVLLINLILLSLTVLVSGVA